MWTECWITVALSFLLPIAPAAAQAAAPPAQVGSPSGLRLRVAVLDLSGSALQMQTATAPTGATTTTVSLPAPADFSRGLTQILTTTLIQQGRFVVLERAALDRVAAEQDLGAAGRVNSETAAAVGKLTGAQALITGDITEFTYQQSSVGSKLSIIKNLSKQIGGKVDRVTAQVAMDLRIIDAATGQVMASVRGQGKASATGVAADLTSTERELAVGGAVQTPLGKASRQAIDEAVEGLAEELERVPWSGRVVDLRGGQIYINAGSTLGVREGMQFEVFAPTEALVDPETGVTLGTPDVPRGRIAVIKVTEKYAVARILGGDGFQRNDLVRHQEAVAAP